MSREDNSMRRMGLLAISCVSLMILVLGLDYFTHSQSEKPEIMTIERRHDFGKVKTWEMLEHTFRVRNMGATVLRIEQVSPD
jgi:hypothetical protein